MKVKLILTALASFGIGWYVGGHTVGEFARKEYREELMFLRSKVLEVQQIAGKSKKEIDAEVASRVATLEEEYQRKLANVLEMREALEKGVEDLEAAQRETVEKAAQAMTDYQAGFLRPVEPGLPKPTPVPTQRIEREFIDAVDYIGSETKYDQIELVYYSGDGVVLVAKTDRVMTEKEAELALGTFQTAFASQGKDSIYVRNHTIRTEFEVTRVEGLYEIEAADA